MSVLNSISRVTTYIQRRGLAATIRRAGVAVTRSISGRMVLYYCDLSQWDLPRAEAAVSFEVEQYRNQRDLHSADLTEITSFWNPGMAYRNLEERFGLGATLWLIRLDKRLAGYGWTLQGKTVEPHYFHFGTEDVHLFDFHVFPQYRGRGVNPALVNSILNSLASRVLGRAFIEAAEWNHPQLASLRKTPFRCLGLARKFKIFGKTMVCWSAAQIERDQAAGGKNPIANREPKVPGLQP